MLGVLLAKDLWRAWRNPLPWLINLIVPLAMTALIGLAFGGNSNGGALGRIHFAVVDEDKSVLSDFLRGGANQREGGKYLDPVVLDRDEALRQINANKISAVVIIPTNFTRDYLTAGAPVRLELIKNPAESIHPAVLEELLGVVVTAMNAISRNFNSEFPEWRSVFEGKEDYHKLSFLIERAGDKLKMVKKFINPPLVAYEKVDDESGSANAALNAGNSGDGEKGSPGAKSRDAKSGKPKGDDRAAMFAYLLIGLSAMFLLFLGQNAMTDLHRELRKGTLERYQTLHQSLWPFIVGKVVFAVAILLLCAAVMLGGGGLIFRVQWLRPFPLLALTMGYACFAAGLFAVLVALVPDERRASALNNIAAMALGLAGGCAFPPQNLPAFVRDYLTPWMPSHWFVEVARTLQFGGADAAWGIALVKLTVCGLILIALAGALFRRRFRAGLRT